MSNDPRPPVWIGHIGPYEVPDISEATEFYTALGMRRVAGSGDMAIMELRGGTHLILQERAGGGGGSAGGRVPFDLMVEDLDATHQTLVAAGLEPTDIVRGRIHGRFEVTDPAGASVSFNDSHVVGPV
jgi:catechol 2,3-dioxygenase-like lactoylglutathione lyase family enzyme